jgi:hypothetical protein
VVAIIHAKVNGVDPIEGKNENHINFMDMLVVCFMYRIYTILCIHLCFMYKKPR